MPLMATVVFTEVVRVSKDKLDNQAIAEAHGPLYGALSSLIEQAQPRLIKKLGNGFMSVHGTFLEALQSSYTQILSKQSEGLHSLYADAWALRIGMCSGPVEIVQGECLGDAVNVAFRLCELASPNDIWADLDQHDISLIPSGFRYGQLGSIPIRGRSGLSTVMKFEPLETVNVDQATQIGAVNEWSADYLTEPMHLDLIHERISRRFLRDQLPIRIGRGEDAHVQIADDRVSRTHVVVEWRHNGPTVIDVSSFGTWVRFQGSEGALLLRREFCALQGEGELILNAAVGAKSPSIVRFKVATGQFG